MSELTNRGKRFSCTPYYPDAPHPANPVPPVRPQPNSVAPTSPPDLVKKFARQGKAEIWESIQYMDHEGMDILREPAANGADKAWSDYLARTKVSSGRFTGDLCPMPYVLSRRGLGQGCESDMSECVEHHLRAQSHHCTLIPHSASLRLSIVLWQRRRRRR